MVVRGGMNFVATCCMHWLGTTRMYINVFNSCVQLSKMEMTRLFCFKMVVMKMMMVMIQEMGSFGLVLFFLRAKTKGL